MLVMNTSWMIRGTWEPIKVKRKKTLTLRGTTAKRSPLLMALMVSTLTKEALARLTNLWRQRPSIWLVLNPYMMIPIPTMSLTESLLCKREVSAHIYRMLQIHAYRRLRQQLSVIGTPQRKFLWLMSSWRQIQSGAKWMSLFRTHLAAASVLLL